MRYFVLDDPHETVAVVFHDYLDRTVICRSVKESIRVAFDSVCERHKSKLEKDGNMLRTLPFSPGDYFWVDAVLRDMPFWSVSKEGSINNTESGIDALVNKHLGGSR